MEVSIEAMVLLIHIVNIRSQLLVRSMKQPGELQQSETARQGLWLMKLALARTQFMNARSL